MTKIYKKAPRGYDAIDPARNLKQAKWMVKGGYGGYTNPIIVQTGRKGDVFPYTIYAKPFSYW